MQRVPVVGGEIAPAMAQPQVDQAAEEVARPDAAARRERTLRPAREGRGLVGVRELLELEPRRLVEGRHGRRQRVRRGGLPAGENAAPEEVFGLRLGGVLELAEEATFGDALLE